jgi:LysR family nitrogen assimilation transcriptional regulator
MKIRWLKAFATVAHEGSITRAAWKLDTSQAALSRVIRDLEGALNIPLFQRTGRGMVLTAEGAALLERANRVIEEYDGLLDLVATLNKQQLGNLIIHLPLRLSRTLMPPFLESFEAQFPMASAEVFESLSPQTQESLSNGKIDIGIYYSPVTAAQIAGERLATEHLHVIAPPRLLGGTDAPIALEEAARLPYLMQSPPSTYRDYIAQAFAANGHTLNVVRNLNTIDAHVQFALSEEAATILPVSVVHREVTDGTLIARRIVEPSLPRDIYIACASRSATLLQREAISLFKAVVRENHALLRWTLTP